MFCCLLARSRRVYYLEPDKTPITLRYENNTKLQSLTSEFSSLYFLASSRLLASDFSRSSSSLLRSSLSLYFTASVFLVVSSGLRTSVINSL